MASPYGLDIFRQAIEDGRSGRAPRAIRPDGSIATDATGAEILVTTEWLKTAFPRQGRTDPGLDRPSYNQAVLGVRNAINDLSLAVRSLAAVRGPGGERLAHTLGIKPSVVEEMRRDLSWVSDELGFCGRVWQERHSEDLELDEDEVQAGAEDEEVDA
jgi:hypothetical protein